VIHRQRALFRSDENCEGDGHEKRAGPERAPAKIVLQLRLVHGLHGEINRREKREVRKCENAARDLRRARASRRRRNLRHRTRAQFARSKRQARSRPKYWNGALSGMPVAILECPSCGKATEATDGKECAIKSLRCTENTALAL
jgi:hypothetical protein